MKRYLVGAASDRLARCALMAALVVLTASVVVVPQRVWAVPQAIPLLAPSAALVYSTGVLVGHGVGVASTAVGLGPNGSSRIRPRIA